MKKHLFALLAPLLFPFLVACLDVTGVEVKFVIPCEKPPPVVTDTLSGTFNGACPYWIQDGDTLKLVTPGVMK